MRVRAFARGGRSGRVLLEEAIEAHGGLERWRAIDTLSAQLRSGGLHELKSTRPWIPRAYTATTAPGRPHTEIVPFSGPGRRGIFDGRAARIESADGHVLAERATPRPGGFGRFVLWDALDALHFSGYSVWNHLCLPFLLLRPGVEVEELTPWREETEKWRRLRATFPESTPTHSREQIFHFDADGLLRRLDCRIARFGRWARGVHYWGEYQELSGIRIAMRRLAFLRLRSTRPEVWVRFSWLDVDGVEVVDRPPAPRVTPLRPPPRLA